MTSLHNMSLWNKPIRDDQCSKCLETINTPLCILVGGLLVDRSAGGTSRDTLLSQLRGVPDELLQGLVVVFDQEQTLGLVDDGAEVFKDEAAFVGEFCVWGAEFGVAGKGGEGDVDLCVGGELAV